jgi:8-oxo-dGTP diphosphatase
VFELTGGSSRLLSRRLFRTSSDLKPDIEIIVLSANVTRMVNTSNLKIRIAAALIDDDAGRLLLVRKMGTQWFMQAGGKIEDDESPMSALRRELSEEIGLAFADDRARHLGTFTAAAANEPNHVVEAEVFHIRVSHDPIIQSEIEEAVWVSRSQAESMPLAPLTRDHILPLSLEICP